MRPQTMPWTHKQTYMKMTVIFTGQWQYSTAHRKWGMAIYISIFLSYFCFCHWCVACPYLSTFRVCVWTKNARQNWFFLVLAWQSFLLLSMFESYKEYLAALLPVIVANNPFINRSRGTTVETKPIRQCSYGHGWRKNLWLWYDRYCIQHIQQSIH